MPWSLVKPHVLIFIKPYAARWSSMKPYSALRSHLEARRCLTMAQGQLTAANQRSTIATTERPFAVIDRPFVVVERRWCWWSSWSSFDEASVQLWNGCNPFAVHTGLSEGGPLNRKSYAARHTFGFLSWSQFHRRLNSRSSLPK